MFKFSPYNQSNLLSIDCTFFFLNDGHGLGVVAMLDVVGAEGILQPEAALVEEGEGDDGLGDADALAAEDSAEAELGHVGTHLLDGAADADGLAVDLGRLHDDLQTAEGVGNEDVDGGDDGGGDEAGGTAAEAGLVAKLLLDVLLQLGLADEAEEGRGQGVAHEGDGAAEEGAEVLGGRLADDLEDGLGRAGLLEVGALLLLDHADGVDEGGAHDGGAGGGDGSGTLPLSHEEGDAEEDAKLGNALEADADEAGADSGHGGRDGVGLEDGLGLGGRDAGVDGIALEVLGVLLHELAVRSDRVVHDGLEGRAAQVGRHGLELGEPSLLHLEVLVGYERDAHLGVLLRLLWGDGGGEQETESNDGGGAAMTSKF